MIQAVHTRREVVWRNMQVGCCCARPAALSPARHLRLGSGPGGQRILAADAVAGTAAATAGVRDHSCCCARQHGRGGRSRCCARWHSGPSCRRALTAGPGTAGATGCTGSSAGAQVTQQTCSAPSVPGAVASRTCSWKSALSCMPTAGFCGIQDDPCVLIAEHRMWHAPASGPLPQRRWPWVLSAPHLRPRCWPAFSCMQESRCIVRLLDVLCIACPYLDMTCLFDHWCHEQLHACGAMASLEQWLECQLHQRHEPPPITADIMWLPAGVHGLGYRAVRPWSGLGADMPATGAAFRDASSHSPAAVAATAAAAARAAAVGGAATVGRTDGPVLRHCRRQLRPTGGAEPKAC